MQYPTFFVILDDLLKLNHEKEGFLTNQVAIVIAKDSKRQKRHRTPMLPGQLAKERKRQDMYKHQRNNLVMKVLR